MKWPYDSFYMKQRTKDQYRKIKKIAFRKENKIKFCNFCKKTWEISYEKTLLTYQHLPTYGKIRKKCPLCVKKEKQNDSKRNKKNV